MESDDKKERESVWPSRLGQDWSELMKDATPEDLARALLRPLRPPKPDSGKKNRGDGE